MTTDAAGLKATIAKHGDTFTLGGNNRKGIFEVLPADRALDYLTQAQIDAATKPLRLAHVAHDDVTAVNDTVTWDSLALTVKKVVSTRHKSATVGKTLVLVQ